MFFSPQNNPGVVFDMGRVSEAVLSRLSDEDRVSVVGALALTWAEGIDSGELRGVAAVTAGKHLEAIMSALGRPLEVDPSASAQDEVSRKRSQRGRRTG